MVKVGDRVPAFKLASDSAETVSAASLKGQRYVLYFYPRDDTPGCTKEACSFRDNLPAFNGLGVPVYGVSADDTASHARFIRKFSLTFPLLSDPERTLIGPLGLWGEKTFMGRKYMGIFRTTIVVDAKGKIEKVWEQVSPEGHADEVLAYLRGEAAPAPQKKTSARKSASTGK